MSFILDALRKSETDRQRQTAPGIADAPQRGQRARRNWWIPLLVFVLAANAALISYLLLRQPPAPASTAVVLPLPPQPPAPDRDRVVTGNSVRSLSAEIEARPEPMAVQPGTTEIKSPTPPLPAIPPAAVARPVSAGEPDGLPSMQQLLLAGVLELPPLRLDIHVFSEQADQRFVFINMRKYREGDSLQEGPRLDNITTQGVILSHRGNRFTLERE